LGGGSPSILFVEWMVAKGEAASHCLVADILLDSAEQHCPKPAGLLRSVCKLSAEEPYIWSQRLSSQFRAFDTLH